ncbi:MAG: hypothetical protein HN704_18350 [Bacteroidetes bacterium]|jgi:hypothetical protein|nr:hypothetical protein [Bacteroidota bacterium]MBT7493565.1 hypothetical protein [Bacteroidota bacterium]
MEENYEILIEILKKSIKKNGEKPLTNKYLLNILLLAEERINDINDIDEYGYPDIF